MQNRNILVKSTPKINRHTKFIITVSKQNKPTTEIAGHRLAVFNVESQNVTAAESLR